MILHVYTLYIYRGWGLAIVIKAFMHTSLFIYNNNIPLASVVNTCK